MKGKTFLTATLFCLISGMQAQFMPGQGQTIMLPPEQKESLVNWLTIEEAQEQNKKAPKPFLIDVYTDWCGWCKQMMKTTYSDPGLAQYINTYFYPIKFNAETKDTIVYNGVKYVNESAAPKSAHQLAKKLLNNSLTYPSTIFVGNNFQFNLLSQGYLDVKKIEPVLIYAVENIFRTSTYEDFKVMFDRTFYDTLKLNHPENVKWLSLPEAFKLQKTKPKKIIVAIGTDWCSGCKVMNQSTFADTLINAYVNKNYYMVRLDAQTKDTLEFEGKQYTPSANPQYPFHTLLPVLTRNNFVLPSLVFLDEKQKIIESVPFYQGPKNLQPILKYFGDNAYQKTKWEEYIKNWQTKTSAQKPAEQKGKTPGKK
jgi:thioredoxin-related protein